MWTLCVQLAILASAVTADADSLACSDKGKYVPKINGAVGILVDVSQFLRHGAVSKGCLDPTCSSTDQFVAESAESCSKVCYMNTDCAWWTFGEVNNQKMCYLRGLTSMAPAQARHGFQSGSRECTASIWPACALQRTIIRNAGKAVWFDATLHGSDSVEGCYLLDCTYTDKFVVTSLEKCASTCINVPECRWWSYGPEDGDMKCWLRTGDEGKEPEVAFTAGSAECGAAAPLRRSAWTQGENHCWGAGFTEDLCCEERFGPTGNSGCWDGSHTFETCCLGEKPAAALRQAQLVFEQQQAENAIVQE